MNWYWYIKPNMVVYLIVLAVCAHSLQATIIIDQPGIHTFNQTLSYNPATYNTPALAIKANNVTLDFNNREIVIDPTTTFTGNDGITIDANIVNVTIKNCYIKYAKAVGIRVGDGCQNINLINCSMHYCYKGGILFEGNTVGIKSGTIDSCTTVACGLTGKPAFGVRLINTEYTKIINSTFAYADAGITSSGYSLWLDNCSSLACIQDLFIASGGRGIVTGVFTQNCSNCYFDQCISHEHSDRDVGTTGTSYGFLFNQSTAMLCHKCISSGNINTYGLATLGYCSIGGQKNIFEGCLSEYNQAGRKVAGFYLTDEDKSYVSNCISRGNETLLAGTAYGILLTGTCANCEIRDNRVLNNKGIEATFGIKDERSPSTSVFIQNYAFNSGTNYSVTYINGVTLPVISASLSQALPGLPSGVGGILDNFSINP